MASGLARLSRQITACRRCPELRAYCAEVAHEKRRAYRDHAYWGKPVPGFGDPAARILLVGLAPGAHGSNRTGRMFTGDASGTWLYRALHKAELASQPVATDRDDGLHLIDTFISAAGRCAPPKNKLTPQQIANCRPWLAREFELLPNVRVVLGIGAVGFKAAADLLVAEGYALDPQRPKFAHSGQARARRGERELTLLATYHVSQQNTSTGVLTEAMLDAILAQAKKLAQT